MMFSKFTSVLGLLVTFTHGQITTYPRASIYPASEVFSLSVGGTAVPAISYYADYDYAQLSMDEGDETSFNITLSENTAISSYSISPKRLNISATVEGSSLVFSVTKAHYLIIKINEEKEFVIVADPTEMDVPPSSGEGIFNINDFHADPTGTNLTTAVQDALNAAGKAPGSIAYVPQGIYLAGNLVIPSHTSLYLARGSVLRFTGNPADYNQLYNKPGLGPGTWWIQSAINSTNCKIYGRGTLDANGYDYQKGGHVAQVIVPVGTDSFLADGPLIRESSFWTVVPTQSNNVLLNNLKILNRIDMVQNDGIDVVESTNVITNRAIAIANDDSFSTKTWPYDANDIFSAYPYAPRPLSSVSFVDLLSWTHCYSFKIGQGVYIYQDDVIFENGVTYTAAVALGIDHKYGTGVAENISWKDIDIEALAGVNLPGVATWMAIFVELSGRGVGPIKNVRLENIRIHDLGDKNALIQGYNSSAMVSGADLINIYLNDSTIPTTNMADLKLTETAYSEDITLTRT